MVMNPVPWAPDLPPSASSFPCVPTPAPQTCPGRSVGDTVGQEHPDRQLLPCPPHSGSSRFRGVQSSRFWGGRARPWQLLAGASPSSNPRGYPPLPTEPPTPSARGPRWLQCHGQPEGTHECVPNLRVPALGFNPALGQERGGRRGRRWFGAGDGPGAVGAMAAAVPAVTQPGL